VSLAALNAALAEGFGPGRMRATAVLQDSPRALVAAGQDAGDAVVVKWFKGERGPVMIQRLQAAHDRIGPVLARPPLLLARYRDLSPDHGLAVLTRAPGLRIDHALRETPHRRADVLALAGRWLAACAAPGRQDGVWNLHARIRKRKESAGPLPPDDAALLGRAMAAMRALARDLAGTPLKLAAAHGDFAPHNLHLADTPIGSELWGFDVQDTRVQPLAADSGRFLALISLRLGPVAGPRRHGLPMADLDAFAGAADLAETPDLPFFVADQLIRSLIEKRHDPAHLAAARALLLEWLEGRE